MAENKKSFVLYADLIHTVKKMPKEKAGELFLTILSYVNDEQPVVDDMLVDLVFEPIKRQMKRDLVAYEAKKKQWSEAGKASAEAKKAAKEAEEKRSKEINEASTKVNDVKNSSTDSTVNVNVNVTDTVNVNVNETVNKKKEDIDVRKLKFAETLKPFLEIYGKDLCNDFYKYWTEPNRSNTKFRQETEKTWDTARRLEKWAKNDKNFAKNSTNGKQQPESKFSQNAAVVNNILSGLDFKPDSD